MIETRRHITNKRYRCELCGALMTEDQQDDLVYVADYGDRYQPPEYASNCINHPTCRGTHEDQEEVWLCYADGCEEIATEDDYCAKHWAILENEGTLDPGGDADAAELMMEER